jgi:Carboxypeptidase regulatory-like domain
MAGNDRVRFCPQCRLNVYNFSAMSAKEIGGLLGANEGRVCARFYQRRDGTKLTQNCPTGFRAAIWRSSKAATLLLSAIFSTVPGYAEPWPKGQSPLAQIQSANKYTLTVSDATGERIPHAQVTLRNIKTGQVLTAQTNDRGQLSTPAFAHGTYDIAVVVPGFFTWQLPAVQIPLTNSIDVQLKLGSIGEVICIPTRNPVQKLVDRVKRFFS